MAVGAREIEAAVKAMWGVVALTAGGKEPLRVPREAKQLSDFLVAIGD